ncbi:thiolase [Pseudomonas sp. PCH199]|uniref:thiolase C-terminal domain-containing protein n=1 Tax=unclassified Pseudomonas TaxID=196821 RepID=UPI000BD7B3D8|nr:MULTISPECIES: thiolase [unclassified Pseudomonas]MCW8278521.1 thiolase [Pseudomonas sp. PCH199]PAM81309.1 thiolase [Pseudomonas sp. ERMR1:02]
MTNDPSRLADHYAIVGIGEAGLGKAEPGDTALSLQCRSARDALLDAGLALADVDGVFAHWDDRANALLVSEYLGITPRHVDSTVVGGGSPLTHLIHAMAAIEAGLCSVALVTYGSTQRLDHSRSRGGVVTDPRSPSGQFIAPYGVLSPISWYAMLAQQYLHRYQACAEDLGAVAINARRWAGLNPQATLREPLTIDAYLASPLICDPLRKADICLVSDGAGALILTRADHARSLAKAPVFIRGFADTYLHHATPLGSSDWLDYGVIGDCANRALRMSGIPRSELSMVQIYDAFTINVLVALEAMEFCAPGQAGAFLRSGIAAPGGALPVNTSGGGLAFNHSGQFGMQLLIESVRQLRGECGERQVANASSCLVQASGLLMSAYMTMVLATSVGD